MRLIAEAVAELDMVAGIALCRSLSPPELLASFLDTLKASIVAPSAEVQEFVVVRPPVVVGPGARVGPFSLLRGPLFIGAGTVIGPHVELTRSIVLSGSTIAHKNTVPDSVIGRDVWIAGHTALANTRLDRAPVRAWTPDGHVVTDRFGATIGSRARIGAQVLIQPGTCLDEDTVVVGPSSCSGRGKVRHFGSEADR